MAKKEVAPVIAELQKLLKEEKLIFGADRALKLLRDGKITKVFLASNVKKTIREDVEQYCSLTGVECVHLDQKGVEVGTLCRKPFSITVVGVA